MRVNNNVRLQTAPVRFSSQLSTTYDDRAATPGEYARRHIAAVYYEAQPSSTVVADWRHNDIHFTDVSYSIYRRIKSVLTQPKCYQMYMVRQKGNRHAYRVSRRLV